MSKRVTATAAKNNFGGLLEDVLEHGRVEILRHGRVVAVVLAPRLADVVIAAPPARATGEGTHMIPAAKARSARVLSAPSTFDED